MEWAISCCTSENETFSSDFQTLCPMEGDLSCKFHVGWTTHESFSLLQRKILKTFLFTSCHNIQRVLKVLFTFLGTPNILDTWRIYAAESSINGPVPFSICKVTFHLWQKKKELVEINKCPTEFQPPIGHQKEKQGGYNSRTQRNRKTRTFTPFLRTQNSFTFRSSGSNSMKSRTSGF